MPDRLHGRKPTAEELAEDRRKKLEEYLRKKKGAGQQQKGEASAPKGKEDQDVVSSKRGPAAQQGRELPLAGDASMLLEKDSLAGATNELKVTDFEEPIKTDHDAQRNNLEATTNSPLLGTSVKRMDLRTPKTPVINSSKRSEGMQSTPKQLSTATSKTSKMTIALTETPRADDPFLSKTPLFPFKRSKAIPSIPFPPAYLNRQESSPTLTEVVKPPCLRLFTLKHVVTYSRQAGEFDGKLLHAMLNILAASGQPARHNPRRHCDYWLLLAECHERDQQLDAAERALEEALQWKCTPVARILQAKDRIAQRRLIAAANTPQNVVTIREESSSVCHSKRQSVASPEDPALQELESVAVKYERLLEAPMSFDDDLQRAAKTPKPRAEVISELAHVIQSAGARGASRSLSATPSKTRQPRHPAPGTNDRGTRIVLTPLRASKRIRKGLLPL